MASEALITSCCGMDADIVVKQGDRLPVLAATLRNESGPIDLTACTILFKVTDPGLDTYYINSACAIVSATAGTVTYSWAAADVDEDGEFVAEFEITTAGGLKQTVPNDRRLTVKILEDADA